MSSRSRSPYTVASPVRLSVCLLSKTLVYPTQAVEMIGIFFYTIWYLGHPLTFTENFTEIIPGNPSVGGGGLTAKGVAKYSDFGLIEGYILETVQDMK